MIKLRGVTKCFRDGDRTVLVLDRLDLDVAAGELVAVLGPSGSGKSTLLYLAGGLDGAFEGEASVAGRSLRSLSPRARARFRNESVGFVFQSYNLLPALTALENVCLPGFFRSGGRPDRAAALAALEQVGLAHKAGKRPALLSGGERQRGAIARALLTRPAVLLADEPTGNLAARSGAAVIELFEALARSGAAVLVATHEERVSRAAGRVLHLEAGRLA